MPVTQLNSSQVENLTDADFASANKDGTAATPSLRTLGSGSQQALAGNATAAAATKLATARNINGVAFDGTADITIKAQAASGFPAPSAPTGLTVGDQGQISGLTGSGVYHYRVYSSTTGTGSWGSPVYDSASASGNATGLSTGAQYFAATATTSDGAEGPYGTVVSHTIAVPAAVTGLTPTAGNTQVSLSWSAGVSGCTYNTYYSTVGSSGPWTLAHSGLSSPADTITGLSNGTLYYFTVEQVRNGFTSAKCTAVSATPAATPACVTANVTVCNPTGPGTTFGKAYNQAVVPGNTLIASVSIEYNGTPTVTVTDSVNGSWSQAGGTEHGTGTSTHQQTWYFSNTGSGTPSVTVNSSAGSICGFILHEYSGVLHGSPYHAQSGGTSGSTPAASIATGTCTAAANELIFAGYNQGSGNLTSCPVAGPFTLRGSYLTGAGTLGMGSADYCVASGNAGATWTPSNSVVYNAQATSFKNG